MATSTPVFSLAVLLIFAVITLTSSQPTGSSDDIEPCRLMAEVPGGCEPTVCPPDSCFIEGNSCLDSNNDCLCKEGLTMSSSGSCVPSTGYCLERQYYVEDDCSAVSCPAGSCVDPDEDCVDSVEKCLCQGGSMMSDEMECVNGDGALVEQTPECMDSFTMSVSGLCESASAPAPGPAAGDDK